jgi:hypothetical protein
MALQTVILKDGRDVIVVGQRRVGLVDDRIGLAAAATRAQRENEN